MSDWENAAPAGTESGDDAGGAVEVGGTALTSPHVYTFAIVNNGPRDAGAGDFDARRPITAEVPGKVVAARWMGDPGQTPKITKTDTGSRVEWAPGHLPRKAAWRLHALVDISVGSFVGFQTPRVDVDVEFRGSRVRPGPGLTNG